MKVLDRPFPGSVARRLHRSMATRVADGSKPSSTFKFDAGSSDLPFSRLINVRKTLLYHLSGGMMSLTF